MIAYRYTALKLACQNNNFNLVKLLVEGFNIGILNETESFIMAFENKNIEILKFLNEHGVEVSCLNETDYQPVFLADNEMNYAIANFLIEQGININKQDESGNTPLIYACIGNKIELIEKLICHQIDIDTQNQDGKTALMSACQNGNLEIVRMLVEHQATVNLRDNNGYSAIAFAYEESNYDIVHYLMDKMNDQDIEEGYHIFTLPLQPYNHNLCCDINKFADSIKISEKYGIMFSVNINKSTDSIIKEWIRNLKEKNITPITSERDKDLLIKISSKGNLNFIQYILKYDNKIDINHYDDEGNSAFSIACEKNLLNIVKYLIEQGIDVNSCNQENITGLMKAVEHGNHSIVRYLIEHEGKNININIVNSKDESAIKYAYNKNYVGIMRYLINHGADMEHFKNEIQLISPFLDTQNYYEFYLYLVNHDVNVNIQNQLNKSTPLINACEKGHYHKVKLLIEKGADINAEDQLYKTPLLNACQQGNLDIIKYLVENGASVNGNRINSDNEGEIGVPLITAFSNNHFAVMKYLIEQGANVKVEDKDHISLFKKVYKNHGNYEFLKFLLSHGANSDDCDLNHYNFITSVSNN